MKGVPSSLRVPPSWNWNRAILNCCKPCTTSPRGNYLQAMQGFAPLHRALIVQSRHERPGRTEPTVDRTCSNPCGVRRTFLTELMAVKVPFAQATDVSACV
jgi:hypothetical protein